MCELCACCKEQQRKKEENCGLHKRGRFLSFCLFCLELVFAAHSKPKGWGQQRYHTYTHEYEVMLLAVGLPAMSPPVSMKLRSIRLDEPASLAKQYTRRYMTHHLSPVAGSIVSPFRHTKRKPSLKSRGSISWNLSHISTNQITACSHTG